MTKIIIIPGLGNSGTQHWQSYWHQHIVDSVRVAQQEWETPMLSDWLITLDECIKAHAPVVLVAHSLAVSLVAHWAAKYDTGLVKAALLVAPADVDSPEHTPDVVRNFAPMPLAPLPFPSMVIASENDPFISLERAIFFANHWKSTWVNVGAKGHINAQSDLGLWEEGLTLLQQLIANLS